MFFKSSKWAHYSREYITQGGTLLITWISSCQRYFDNSFIYKYSKEYEECKKHKEYAEYKKVWTL